MTKELTIEEVIEKVEKYINQLLPLPTCPTKKMEVDYKRSQVKKRLSKNSKSVGPVQLK